MENDVAGWTMWILVYRKKSCTQKNLPWIEKELNWNICDFFFLSSHFFLLSLNFFNCVCVWGEALEIRISKSLLWLKVELFSSCFSIPHDGLVLSPLCEYLLEVTLVWAVSFPSKHEYHLPICLVNPVD